MNAQDYTPHVQSLSLAGSPPKPHSGLLVIGPLNTVEKTSIWCPSKARGASVKPTAARVHIHKSTTTQSKGNSAGFRAELHPLHYRPHSFNVVPQTPAHTCILDTEADCKKKRGGKGKKKAKHTHTQCILLAGMGNGLVMHYRSGLSFQGVWPDPFTDKQPKQRTTIRLTLTTQLVSVLTLHRQLLLYAFLFLSVRSNTENF